MLITIRNQRSQIIDIQAEISWTANGDRQLAKASITIPRDSPGWSAEVIDERGGFIVECDSRYGRFVGVADRPQYTELGAEITVHHIGVWLSLRRVRNGLTIPATTAGTILRIAFADAFSGRASTPLILGSILDAPPLITEFSFHGQTFLDVVTQLMDETGHVWEIDERLRFNWGARQGQYRPYWLIDDGQLFARITPGTMGDQYAETLETSTDGHSTTIYANDVPMFWPAQRVVRI